MANFEFNNPVRLVFGAGRVAEVGKLAQQYGKKALIVTSGSSRRTGLLDRIEKYLSDDGVDYVVYDKVQPNPLTSMVEEAVQIVKTENCDVIIGLGGGSPMDTAKGIAFAAVNEGNFVEYVLGKTGKGALPIILITTTAGTGSEGNSIGVFTNPETNDKKGMKTPFTYAKASIIDPELMTTLPARSIAGPGLDALFHSIEAYISRKGNAMSDMIALQAIMLISEYLPRVYQNNQDIEAWEKVALANTLGGMAIDAGGTALPHAMEHPLSGLLNITHGEGLAAIYPAILNFTYQAAPQKFADIAQAMGADISGMSLEQAAAKSIECVEELRAKVDMTATLSDLGVKEEHLDWCVDNAFKIMRMPLENNPRIPDKAEVKEIYRQSL